MRTRTLALVSLLAAALPAASMIPPGTVSYHGAKKFSAFKTKAKPKPAAPNDAFHLGLASLDARDYNAAIANFSKAVQQRPAADRYFLLGYAYYSRGFRKGAPETASKLDAVEVVNAYKTALSIDPNLKEVQQPYKLYHGLGMAYEALGLNEKAIDAYRTAFMKAPSNLALPLYGARLRMKMGATRKSLANLDMALKLANKNGQQADVDSFLKSNAMFADLLKSPDHAALVAKYSVPDAKPAQLVAMERMVDADATYGLRDSVRSPAPKKPTAAPAPASTAQDEEVLQAIASGNDEFKFRHWAKAIDRYDWALAVNRHSRTLGPGETAFVEERIGSAYNRLGQTTEALTALLRSVQAMPYNSAAHYQLALAYSVSGHYGEAVKSLRESFKTAPSPIELRKTVLLAKTDTELEPLRERPEYRAALKEYGIPPSLAKR